MSEPPAESRLIPLAEVTVVIPALNEEESLPEVLRRLAALGLRSIVVVDNGSSDDTAAVAHRLGASVVSEPRRGYGRACWAGSEARPASARWILFANADGSDDLESFPEMMEAAERGAELVLGRRPAGPDQRDHLTEAQRFGNWLATLLMRVLWGRRYGDLGPLRLISREALDRLGMQNRGFGWTVEMQVRAVEEALSVAEVPVRNFARTAGTSKISGSVKGSVQAGGVILATIFKLWLCRPIMQRWMQAVAALGMVLGAVLMVPWGVLGRVGQAPQFLAAAGIMGAGYALSWVLRSPRAALMWTVAVLVRLILLVMEPGYDIWRYLWEGRVTFAGLNPYQMAPNAQALSFLQDAAVWPQVGHPALTAVYPPLAQLSFAGITAASSTVLAFKLVFVLADLGVALLLHRRFGLSSAMLYAWNPIVVYSFAGGGHYDSLFLLPLVGGLMLADKESGGTRWLSSAVLAGVSMALKYASGPLAFWWLWQGWNRGGPRMAAATGPSPAPAPSRPESHGPVPSIQPAEIS